MKNLCIKLVKRTIMTDKLLNVFSVFGRVKKIAKNDY